MKNNSLLILLLSTFSLSTWPGTPVQASTPNNPPQKNTLASHLLWYDKPATYFEESLVLGNGKMGASVFGGVSSDKIYLNDITLWSGEPIDPNNNPEAHTYVEKVREALWQEDYRKADSLNRFIQGQFTQSYAPLGTMFIRFKGHEHYSNYRRDLDLSRAVSTTSYEVDGVRFRREYFISHPRQLMLIRLSSSKASTITCSISFESLLKYSTRRRKGSLEVQGHAPIHAEPSYRGDMPDAVVFREGEGTRFTGIFRVNNLGGSVSATDSSLELRGCSEAEIYISLATSFKRFDIDPAGPEANEDYKQAANQLKEAEPYAYRDILMNHISDYQSFYNRLELDLGEGTAPDLPTDQRLLRYAGGAVDRGLEVLYFNFGRYLLISSSRTNSVPANLQGLWNPYLRPPWSSNYTVNINLPENYWLAETANLSELHKPLLSFIRNLSETGAVTARTYYGVGGWCVGHNSDIWATTNPVGDFGQGQPSWANWNMGGVWLSTHLWEHYAFTRDRDFLKNEAYPMLEGAVRFCLEWMVQDAKSRWITSPSTSPENWFRTPDGYGGATLYGATADLAMIRELFSNYQQASMELNKTGRYTAEIEKRLPDLYPYQVGKKGNLQEWYHDWEDGDPQHRHQTHLFGLHPGRHITPYSTPDLAAACRTTLEIKGDETTGWSKGWRINLWARLWDGNRAYKMYRELLNYVDPDGMNGSRRGGGTYPNLFDAHPPFQIDGNFGGAAGVLEMLVQSGDGRIYLLPALPDAWEEGKISGVCARGGFELELEWEKGSLVRTRILARSGGKTTLVYGEQQREIELDEGKSSEISWQLP